MISVRLNRLHLRYCTIFIFACFFAIILFKSYPYCYNFYRDFGSFTSISFKSSPVNIPTKESIIQFSNEFKNPCWYEYVPSPNFLRVEKNLRCLPYFLQLGTPKSGTSDLWMRINKHPDVIEAGTKEPEFWSKHRFSILGNPKNFAWYLKHFDGITKILQETCNVSEPNRRDSHCSKFITGDGSPCTLAVGKHAMKELQYVLTTNEGGAIWRQLTRGRLDGLSPKIPKRDLLKRHFTMLPFTNADVIRKILPDAKFIVIMRNPAERLYSGFRYMNSKLINASPQQFDIACNEALKNFDICQKNNSARSCAYLHPYNIFLGDMQLPYLEAGLYSIYIKDWLSVFPKEQFIFIRTEDYVKDVSGTLEKVFRHLGLDSLDEDAMQTILKESIRNQNIAGRGLPMLPSTRKKLNNFYGKFNQELAQILMDDKFLWDDYNQ